MVELGFVVVYLGFAYAPIALYLALRRVRGQRDRPADVATVGAAVGAAVVLVGFSLPSISGFPEGTITSWEGLDPLSTIASVAVVVVLGVYAARPGAGDDVRPQLVVSLSASLAGLVAGNLIIQSWTDRGTDAEIGLYVASAGSVVALLSALAGLRRVS